MNHPVESGDEEFILLDQASGDDEEGQGSAAGQPGPADGRVEVGIEYW
jgi:hypothetical protein